MLDFDCNKDLLTLSIGIILIEMSLIIIFNIIYINWVGSEYVIANIKYIDNKLLLYW